MTSHKESENNSTKNFAFLKSECYLVSHVDIFVQHFFVWTMKQFECSLQQYLHRRCHPSLRYISLSLELELQSHQLVIQRTISFKLKVNRAFIPRLYYMSYKRRRKIPQLTKSIKRFRNYRKIDVGL